MCWNVLLKEQLGQKWSVRGGGVSKSSHSFVKSVTLLELPPSWIHFGVKEAWPEVYGQIFFCGVGGGKKTLFLFPPGLTMHASILAYMFNLVEEGKISITLNTNTPVNNQVYVQEYVANLLKTAFPHLQE